MLSRLILLIALFVTPLASASDIFMIARAKVNDSTLTSVVFFNSHEITTLKECETERRYGSRNNWRVFTHVLNTGGVSYGTQYRCATSPQKVSKWFDTDPYTRKYLVRYDQNKNMTVTPYDSIADCRRQVMKEQDEENINLFCASSNQDLIKS
ncbi:hypothetical protein [Parendozoicomonas haliclonae]|uniref:Uncharacterized protein n=1 Tax=Parendozoicomonas haliclonae TaxID=1960125 RepID=A0A1X7AF60_9GAMM|nr:hypothetical protein [Parendozoicomonas haliclonae]SMA34739.1 hypothetical protein EHSB41UT_00443 [Parendozoicomonas haliclonae]